MDRTSGALNNGFRQHLNAQHKNGLVEGVKRRKLSSNAKNHTVNGLIIRENRKNLGWSQVELGHRSGYSERVIRKAEAGGSLRLQTILDLAMTMSVQGRSVSLQDLTIDFVSIARRFVESYDWLGRKMLSACRDLFHPDFSFSCSADPKQVSFAGVWKGPHGFQEFLDRFFDTFTRERGTLKPIFMASHDRVVARFEDQVRFHGQEMSAYWVNFHFQFRDGLLIRIDDEFDSLNLSRSIEQLQLTECC